MIPHDVIDQIESKHIEWLKQQFAGETGKALLEQILRGIYDAWLASPIHSLINRDALRAVLQDLSNKKAVDTVVKPLHAAILPWALATLRQEKEKLGSFLTPEAKAKIDVLLGRPNLLPEKFVAEVVEQDAMEELMRDVLYDALKEFSEKVNPFFADWGLPGLLKKMSPFGFGAISKTFEGLRSEFDKRLDPEMRKFLLSFSRRALRKGGDFVIAHNNDPSFVAFRKKMAAWILEQSVSDLMLSLDDETAKATRECTDEIASSLASNPILEKKRDEAADKFLAAFGALTVKDFLAQMGVTLDINWALVREASWPAFYQIASHPVVEELVFSWVRSFYQSLKAS